MPKIKLRNKKTGETKILQKKKPWKRAYTKKKSKTS